MKKNRLGNSELYVSELSLGCMSLGTDQKEASKIIDSAVENGINYLDTADLYDQGLNEELIGQAIKHKRKDLIVATKVGNHLKEDGSWYWDPSKTHIKNQVKESLKRLQTDYIDLYQLHGGTIEDPTEETIEAFEDLVKEGYIRYYGISSIRPNVIRKFVEKSNMISVMMQYSLLDRRPEIEMLDLLNENNISVVARGPLAKGMLSDEAVKKVEEKGKDGYLEYSYEELAKTAQVLDRVKSKNISINGLALKYVLEHDAVASAVFGASSQKQLKTNINGMDTAFNRNVYETLKQLTKPINYTKHLN
ncbi:aldo/keto reductase [Saliterribacillus persicus]|uniref:Aryl-alcohol dehydrogenase-like predicted oxidoreductase n=1 Tax=Saliterribacillus persicus TaxID=930114 RepID=A0A368XC91_9BACI|nr:aldo/keto reductase [Saliterribacillus persicus]RCW64846.1 aryl-alcohol dehydrogenase-like predicted oxidoreductase [Saliterribacillus persicus]